MGFRGFRGAEAIIDLECSSLVISVALPPRHDPKP